MFIKYLTLTNFRNYSNLNIEFDHRPAILVGNNAAGKSNLLEAIYLLSTSKSLRAEKEDELILDNQNFTRVEGFVVDGGETELMVIINRAVEEVNFKKKVLVNGISRRAMDFIGNLPAVIFYPSDINMVTGAPALRRWHLDLTLAQINSEYKRSLTLYEHFLTARNRVLKRIKEGFGKAEELTYWTEELVSKGKMISEERKIFFEFVNKLEKPLGEFVFEYKPSEISKDLLSQTNGREVAAAATLIGPHRDDFLVLSETKDLSRMRESDHQLDPSSTTSPQDSFGRNLSRFGSRGEQRTATLAFKLAQLEYMAKILGKRPILLLDDVFSELDANHRAHVVEVVSKQQTIIATVELENIPKDFLNSARILKVENGKLSEL